MAENIFQKINRNAKINQKISKQKKVMKAQKKQQIRNKQLDAAKKFKFNKTDFNKKTFSGVNPK